jgi:aldehyde dehydrogenase (NAD+)
MYFFYFYADVLRQANDTVYGLAAAVFSKDINRALTTAHKLQAGTAWVRLVFVLASRRPLAHICVVQVNCVNQLHANVPFGGGSFPSLSLLRSTDSTSTWT